MKRSYPLNEQLWISIINIIDKAFVAKLFYSILFKKINVFPN